MFASRRLGKFFGIEAVPIPLVPVPLPVRYRIYYGDPIPVHERYDPSQADNPSVLKEVAAEVKAAVHELIQQGLADRKGVFQ